MNVAGIPKERVPATFTGTGRCHDRVTGVIVGIGVDAVDVVRFERILRRTPRVADRLFTAREQARSDGTVLGVTSLASRFAAKEAVAKALGCPPGMEWHDCEVVSLDSGRPVIELTRTVAAASAGLGVVHWHLSLSHDGGFALAYAVAESA